MASMEKVIKGLKKCSKEGVDCKHCPYDGEGTKERSCESLMERDALKVIREQNQRIWEILTEKERLAEELHKLIQHCDNVDADALLGRKVVDIRRDVPGLWCDDITFCQEKCTWKDCPRNSVNIRDRTVPHSYAAETPEDCPKRLGGR